MFCCGFFKETKKYRHSTVEQRYQFVLLWLIFLTVISVYAGLRVMPAQSYLSVSLYGFLCLMPAAFLSLVRPVFVANETPFARCKALASCLSVSVLYFLLWTMPSPHPFPLIFWLIVLSVNKTDIMIDDRKCGTFSVTIGH